MYTLLIKLKRILRRLLRVQSEVRLRPAPTPRSRAIKFGLLVAVSLLVGLIYPGEELVDPLGVPREGEISHEDIIAPYDLVIKKTERELREERELTRVSIPYVLDEDTLATQRIFADLHGFLGLTDSLSELVDASVHDDLLAVEHLVTERYPSVARSAARQSLIRHDHSTVAARLDSIFRQVIYDVGVIADGDTLTKIPGNNVLVRHSGRENIYPESRVADPVRSYARLRTELRGLAAVDSTLDTDYYYEVGRSFIRPNLRINHEEYVQRVQTALDGIDPIKDEVEKGALIVRARARVTAEQDRQLQELVRRQREEASRQGWAQYAGPLIGRIVLAAAAFIGLYLFLFFFRPDVYRSNVKILALILVFAIQLALVYLVFYWEASIYLYPVALLPMMVAILFDAETSLLSTIVLALLLGIFHRFNFSLTLTTFVVGVVAGFASQRVRRRSHFVRAMFAVGVAYAFTILVVESVKVSPGSDVLTDMGYGVVNGVVCGFLTIGLLPFFESIFGITTDITLLELSDLNHPLLKRLALEAPGTFQHSLSVGNLAEAGAKAIGANSLLARVGTYYHDIGKMEIPEYFVENQLSVKSKHDELTPSMSTIILSAHVKKGRALGEEAGLPDDVLNFIEEHHGTMVMSYFYDKAIKQGTDPAAKDKFRYPGPKPQSRETAIAMLADAVEAAARTLDEPTSARVSNLIQRIINDRFQSGELDECPLTLRDLARIRVAFTQVLIAAFHQRVVYPVKEKVEEEV